MIAAILYTMAIVAILYFGGCTNVIVKCKQDNSSGAEQICSGEPEIDHKLAERLGHDNKLDVKK